MTTKDWVGGIVGLIVVSGIVTLIVWTYVSRARVDRPADQADERERLAEMGRFVQHVGATVYQSGHQPEFGVLPHPPLPRLSGTGQRNWNRALVRFHYRGHELLAIDHTRLERRARYGTQHKRIRVDYSFVELRTPTWPRTLIRPQSMGWLGNLHTDTNTSGLTRIALGHPGFDAVLEVLTEDERFVRSLLRRPVLDFLATDPRFHIRWFMFEQGAIWTQYTGRLRPDETLERANAVVDLADRLAYPVRPHRR